MDAERGREGERGRGGGIGKKKKKYAQRLFPAGRQVHLERVAGAPYARAWAPRAPPPAPSRAPAT